MSNHTIAPGFTISDVEFASTFSAAAAAGRLSDTGNSDPFKWRVVVGKFDPKSGQQAFKTTCSFTPKGAPPGTAYGIKQIAYHRFSGSYYKGQGDENGSQELGTTSVNFTWNLDCAAEASGRSFSVPSLPFFSENPVPVGNGTSGSLTVIDAPGGTARLVRPNVLTGKRNYLQTFSTATDFITMLIVVRPDATHVAVRGLYWTFSSETTVTWQDEKPTLKTAGRCAFDSLVDPAELRDGRLAILTNNAAAIQDTIGFKVNNGLLAAETQDAAAPITTGSSDTERRFNGGTYEIVHSRKLLQ